MQNSNSNANAIHSYVLFLQMESIFFSFNLTFSQSFFLTSIPISILLAVANLRHSFIVNYANLWGSWSRRHRGCMGSLFPSWKTCLPSHDWNLFLFWLLSHSTDRSVITPRRGRISLFSATYSCPTGKPVIAGWHIEGITVLEWDAHLTSLSVVVLSLVVQNPPRLS